MLRRPHLRRRTVAAAALNNADFYDAQGKFKPEAAKEPICVSSKRPGTPSPNGCARKCGCPISAWATSPKSAGRHVLGQQPEGQLHQPRLLPLPGQMIPEHWHVPLPAENVPVKMESWHVRWGSTYTYGEGEPTAKLAVKIPACEQKYVTVRHEKALKLGDVTGLTRPEQKHWQQAGPEEAIVTETSTFHSGAAVRFTDPRIKF